MTGSCLQGKESHIQKNNNTETFFSTAALETRIWRKGFKILKKNDLQDLTPSNYQ